MTKKTKAFSIKDWSRDDRPREKLLRKNRSVLSDAELVAILIGSGSSGESAVSLAKRIMAKVNNNLHELGKLSVQQLMKFNGIGEAKAVAIIAALELGRRRRKSGRENIDKISNSRSAFEFLQPTLADLPHEEFWIAYLNNSNRVIQSSQLSKGGITGTLVDVRLVMKQALEVGAVALLLAHNHPSGTLKPSKADIEITRKIKTAALALDIRILDHLIIASDRYFSFADEAML
ncbi:MAG: DNA repair protein RadC [Eudoraea sp.]|nr:DNA repair protein RadC [Eudoraea sp.]